MSGDAKVCLITGATSGIGRETTIALVEAGMEVYAVARNEQKAQDLVEELEAGDPAGSIDYFMADLSKQSEIRQLAEKVDAGLERLDILINNAGAMFTTRQETEDGYEMTFALNHLNYFLLTNLLLDKLKASAPSRIINVASGAHFSGTMHWDDLQLEDGFGKAGWAAYCQSKLCNVLFTRELAKRLEGTGVTANCMHPGFVRTGFGRNNGFFSKLLIAFSQLFARSPKKGAETVIWMARAPALDEESGNYYFDTKVRKPSREARDDEAAKRLWELSEEMTGLTAGQPG